MQIMTLYCSSFYTSIKEILKDWEYEVQRKIIRMK